MDVKEKSSGDMDVDQEPPALASHGGTLRQQRQELLLDGNKTTRIPMS